VALDPLEAGRRAYRFYKEKGGCGTASYLSLLSLLKEKVGFPWTTMPDMLMAHAAAGFGGHGTLCGALAGVSTIINMVTFGEKRDAYLQNSQIIDRLFWWYAEQDFPPTRFDDLSPMPKQLQVKAMSPLCHTSVSKWALEAKATINSDAKIERCAKVAGEVAFTVTTALNEYFAGKWVAPAWKPSPGRSIASGATVRTPRRRRRASGTSRGTWNAGCATRTTRPEREATDLGRLRAAGAERVTTRPRTLLQLAT
jgi:hypothetical protein